MTGPLNGAKPSSTLCRKAGCKDLVAEKVQVANGEKTVYYCSACQTAVGKHVLKIPGNLYRCPKEDPSWV